MNGPSFKVGYTQVVNLLYRQPNMKNPELYGRHLIIIKRPMAS